MKQLIFCDFDGVIRHWDNRELFAAEKDLNLRRGATFKVAFAAENLIPAITGKVTDPTWRKNVYEQLAKQYTHQQAKKLINRWDGSPATIDFHLFGLFQKLLPKAKIALVTNATSRLSDDLAKLKLAHHFDFVINSSKIGVAKPNQDFYKHAVEVTDAKIDASIFIDDSIKNVQAAETFGLKGFHFQNARLLQKEIEQWLTTK